MALSSSTVFEVESGGSDNNGGGFVTGASGTDYSQQTSAQWALTGIATTGTGSTFLYASAAATMVGNLCQVISGTNFTTGVFQIVSVSVGVSVTVDRAVCTGVGASGVINIGGCFATIAKALALNTVTNMITYVKAATYTISTALTFPSGPNYNTLNRLIGYGTVRGDLGAGGRPVVKVSAAINGINIAQSGCSVENLIFDGNSAQGLQGIMGTVEYGDVISNCVARYWSQEGISDYTDSCGHINNEVHHCAGTSGAYTIKSTAAFSCYSHDNSVSGFYALGISWSFINCVATNNTGKGFYSGNNDAVYINCVAYNNTSDGFIYAYGIEDYAINCIAVNNGGYGLNDNLGGAVTPLHQNCAFYNNTSGSYHNVGAGLNDVTLTGVPFTNAASGDFSLNNIAGQGAACRNAGISGITPFGTGYADIGALRHQDPAGSSSEASSVF